MEKFFDMELLIFEAERKLILEALIEQYKTKRLFLKSNKLKKDLQKIERLFNLLANNLTEKEEVETLVENTRLDINNSF